MKHLHTKTKAVLIFGGGTALLFFLSFLHLYQSSQDMAWTVVLEALQNQGDTVQHSIVKSVYLPRIALGLIAGAALAAAGVIFQTLTKNPLAAPSTLGVHAGAYFFVVAGAALGSSGPAWLFGNGFLFAFLGGSLAAVLVFALSGGVNATPVRMALAGLVLSLMFSSFTAALQIFFEYETAGLFLWGNGSLVQQDWSGVLFALPWTIVITIMVFLISRQMDIMLLGSDQAKALGEKTKRVQVIMFFLAVGLSALTVSVAGPIAFIGLIAPHLMRLAGFQLHSLLIPASMLWGANILIGADILGRFLDPSLTEMPVGSVTALIGAPWLIWLVLKHRGSFFGSGSKESISGSRLPFTIPYPMVLTGSGLLLAIVFFIGMAGGSTGFEWVETWRALFTEEASGQRFIIFDLRLGRMLAACAAGMLLAASGLLFQGILRNPLADPSVIGVTAGAGVGALSVLFFFSSLSAAWLPAGAIAGAFLTVAVVLFFSWKTQFHPAVLALMGIAVSAAGGAITQILIVRSNLNAASALTWLSGSTYASGFTELQMFLVWPLFILIPAAFFLLGSLNILALGDNNAIGLGVPLTAVRWFSIILATFSAAMAVAAVGTIGFIGLVAPHLARLLVGEDYRKIFPVALLLGAALLVGADAVGRIAIAPKEIPSGLVAAIIGAPFFLWLMSRTKK